MSSPAAANGVAIDERHGYSKRMRQERRTGALLVVPTVLVITIVIVVPIVIALRDSFFGVAGIDKEGFYQDTAPFVALENYAVIFGKNGTRFWNAMWNTTLFGVVTVVLETFLGVIMALIMHKAMRGRGLVRAAILIPWAVPTAVSAVLWKWIFDAHGAANALLGTQILWSTGDWSAKMAVIIADVWKTAPFIGLLTLAGLQVIPDEVYEAAKIDGAGVWKRFTAITMPLVKPALIVAILFRALDALRMYDLPYILIGARKSSVETMSMLVQDEASNVRYGAAAAYALILFLYIFIIAFVFIRVLGADVVGSGGQQGTKLRVFRRRKHRPTGHEGEEMAAVAGHGAATLSGSTGGGAQ